MMPYPCHVDGRDWPKLERIEIANAKDTEVRANTEKLEIKRFGSNSRTMRYAACIDPKPSPRAHPNGGDARIEETPGLPRRNRTNEDSRAPINNDRGIRLASGTFTALESDSKIIVVSNSSSTARARRTPATIP